MRRAIFVSVALVAGCGDKEVILPPTDHGELLATLEALAAMGQKQAGTPEGAQATEYIEGRFRDLGLADVHRETFGFPMWKLVSKQLTVTIDGALYAPPFDVFEASGSGMADGPVVDVGTASDLTG